LRWDSIDNTRKSDAMQKNYDKLRSLSKRPEKAKTEKLENSIVVKFDGIEPVIEENVKVGSTDGVKSGSTDSVKLVRTDPVKFDSTNVVKSGSTDVVKFVQGDVITFVSDDVVKLVRENGVKFYSAEVLNFVQENVAKLLDKHEDVVKPSTTSSTSDTPSQLFRNTNRRSKVKIPLHKRTKIFTDMIKEANLGGHPYPSDDIPDESSFKPSEKAE
jgi:hypothetical protein